MRTTDAQMIMTENRRSYDAMAEEFSSSRVKFWEELAFLAEHAIPGDRVLDIGCGNGRLYPLLKERNVAYTGLDNSAGLLTEARRLHPVAAFIEGDATMLPFADHAYDIVFSFATIHHIPSRELREKFVHEVARVLNHGSTFILTAWDLWQPRHFGKYLYSLLASINPLSTIDAGDMILTFGREKRKRYLHAFTKKELTLLLTKNGFDVIGVEIVARKSGQKNIVIVAKKK